MVADADTWLSRRRGIVSLAIGENPVPATNYFAAMQQIADWLKKLGMLKYLQRFAENDVDEAVLRHLSDRT
jgi:hypothetical protein